MLGDSDIMMARVDIRAGLEGWCCCTNIQCWCAGLECWWLQHQHSVLLPGPRPGLDLNVSAAKPTMLVLCAPAFNVGAVRTIVGAVQTNIEIL